MEDTAEPDSGKSEIELVVVVIVSSFGGQHLLSNAHFPVISLLLIVAQGCCV